MGYHKNALEGLRLGVCETADWRRDAIDALLKDGSLWCAARTEMVSAARYHGYRCGRSGQERAACTFRSEETRVAWEEGYARGCRHRQ